MKKIRCPHCAVINLEKFVTFPYCAGCGALLPPVTETVSAWRRPLRPLLWGTVAGCGAVALVMTTRSFEAPPPPPSQLVIYGAMPRITRVGAPITARLAVDTVGPRSAVQDQALEHVQVRVPLRFFKAFRFAGIEPRPDRTLVSGSGRHFYYDVLPSENRLKLTLLPVQPGRYKLETTIYALDQKPGTYRAAITVVAPPARPGAAFLKTTAQPPPGKTGRGAKRHHPKRIQPTRR